MAGHSKWANIKHKKERTDAKKGKVFTKIGREIAVAVKQGGADPESNTKLKDVIAKAKAANMPNDNISRCIKKASGDVDTDNFDEIVYEGYGPEGTAFIVEAMTDNRNRTAADVRHYFDKFGGNLGSNGCVSFMFNRKGVIVIEKNDSIDEDEFMLEAIEAGAEDVIVEEEYIEVLTQPNDFSNVRESMEKYNPESAAIEYVPTTYSKISDEKYTALMEKLIDHLEDLDDVQNVYHNWEHE